MNAAISQVLTPTPPEHRKCSLTELARFHYRAAKHAWKCNRGEIAFLRRHLRPGQTAVDIGAHKGAFTFWMRKMVGASGRVIAFEPQAPLARRLANVAFTLRWNNVHVEACAISDQSGASRLLVPQVNGSPGARLLHSNETPCDEPIALVQTMTLDEIFFESAQPPDFIKCDSEGHERRILQGASRLLRLHRPILLLELEARHMGKDAMMNVFAMLRDLRYTGWFFHRAKMRPLAEFDLSRHQAQSPAAYWKSAGYCNNFAFVPS